MRTSRLLLLCGAAAGPLFVLTFAVAGATRAGYDPLRHPVSSLALGPYGWAQTVNFLVAGALTVAFAVGIRRVRRGVAGPLLVGVWGLGLIGAGLFVTDPVSGYPPGTPDRLAAYGSTHALLHDLASLVGFVAIVAAMLVLARGWAAWSIAAAIDFLAAFVLSSTGFSQDPAFVAHAGLYQRVMVVVGWAWLTALAVRLLQHLPAGRPA